MTTRLSFLALLFASTASSLLAYSLQDEIAGAPPGATLHVPAGLHNGPFVLEKPVTLLGEKGAVLRGDGLTHVVAVRAPDCTIDGFEIRRSGLRLADDHAGIHITAPRCTVRNNLVTECLHGIYVRRAADCRIIDNHIVGTRVHFDVPNPVMTGVRPSSEDLCTTTLEQDERGNGIHLWNSSGHVIQGNTIEGTRDGIYFSFTDRTLVTNNRIHQVRYGLHYMYSDENRFEHNVFTENAAGAALMFSRGIVLRDNTFAASRSHRAYGLLMLAVEDTRVEGNRIQGNTLGLYLENSNRNQLVQNTVTANHVGMRLSDSSSDNLFTENILTGNLHPVETTGSNNASVWSLNSRGNYWDDALVLDLDGNGVSELPHHEPDLFGGLRRSFPAIGLLSGSPGERLIRFIHRRLALPGLPSITDPYPLARERGRK